MQFAADPVSADDEKISNARARRIALRDEHFPEGVLLRQLPVHVERRRGRAALSFLASLLFCAAAEAGLNSRLRAVAPRALSRHLNPSSRVRPGRGAITIQSTP